MTHARSLSLHERYSVARRSVESPSIVAAAALVHLDASDQAFEQLQAHLARRIDSALQLYPLLGYCVQSPRSRKPTWAPMAKAPTSSDILRLGAAVDGVAGDKIMAQALLGVQLSLPETSALETGPLWQVQLHRVQDSQGALVVLATDHAINDGRGTLNLFRFLLQATEPPNAPAAEMPKASDVVFDFKPSVRYMLGMVWKELLLPKLPLPSKLATKLRGPVSWPEAPVSAQTNEVGRCPKGCAPALDTMLVSAPQLITNLKQLAHAHNPAEGKPATLHAVLHTLALAALYAAIARPLEAHALGEFDMVFRTGTPISLRTDAPGLPEVSGNYVSSYTCKTTLRGGVPFWTEANRFSAKLASPRGRNKAKHHMGMLAYIPDFEGDPEAYANGWEKFFGSRMESSTPFDAAFTVSNLGMIDLSTLHGQGWKVTDASWAQSHTPQGEAFGIDVLGYNTSGQQCLSIGLSSRPSAFQDKALHDRFVSYLNHLVRAFASTPEHEKQQDLDLDSNPSFADIALLLYSALPNA
ncbi:hypothetical protein PaG_01171 [Moesziomyces aphidis]|uniref:Alcohol acetyltransferase n=1 Tax=Moesziomyces aphidis TaxID=84754 RepID=W3VU71_MOEAP|nr:hypothetical protein PaG_01171 [Moesziomyces aphidis]